MMFDVGSLCALFTHFAERAILRAVRELQSMLRCAFMFQIGAHTVFLSFQAPEAQWVSLEGAVRRRMAAGWSTVWRPRKVPAASPIRK